jgi:hypothetical protein
MEDNRTPLCNACGSEDTVKIIGSPRVNRMKGTDTQVEKLHKDYENKVTPEGNRVRALLNEMKDSAEHEAEHRGDACIIHTRQRLREDYGGKIDGDI